MRNISFMITPAQIRARTKDVTRRLNWHDLKVGERLQGCEKCQGRKPGEPLVKLAVVEVVSIRRERLGLMIDDEAYGRAEVVREGFPEMSPGDFVAMFVRSHKKSNPESFVSRIEFRYV